MYFSIYSHTFTLILFQKQKRKSASTFTLHSTKTVPSSYGTSRRRTPHQGTTCQKLTNLYFTKNVYQDTKRYHIQDIPGRVTVSELFSRHHSSTPALQQPKKPPSCTLFDVLSTCTWDASLTHMKTHSTTSNFPITKQIQKYFSFTTTNTQSHFTKATTLRGNTHLLHLVGLHQLFFTMPPPYPRRRYSSTPPLEAPTHFGR